MPIYEYELELDECLMCPGRFEALQEVADEPLKFCPHCGLAARRVVSRASIQTSGKVDYEKAARRGLTTWRRTGKGQWEKVAGPGVDAIVGSPEDMAAIDDEKA